MSKQKTIVNDEDLSKAVGGSGKLDDLINLVNPDLVMPDRQENSISLSTSDGKCGYYKIVVDGICQMPDPYIFAGTPITSIIEEHPCYGCKYYKLTPKN